MPHLTTLAELKDGMRAYVEEDNRIHLPEAELSDEQLLQYIDHYAKYSYTIEQRARSLPESRELHLGEAQPYLKKGEERALQFVAGKRKLAASQIMMYYKKT